MEQNSIMSQLTTDLHKMMNYFVTNTTHNFNTFINTFTSAKHAIELNKQPMISV